MVEGFYPLIQVYSFIIGISVGSFLNVMIYQNVQTVVTRSIGMIISQYLVS